MVRSTLAGPSGGAGLIGTHDDGLTVTVWQGFQDGQAVPWDGTRIPDPRHHSRQDILRQPDKPSNMREAPAIRFRRDVEIAPHAGFPHGSYGYLRVVRMFVEHPAGQTADAPALREVMDHEPRQLGGQQVSGGCTTNPW